MQESKEWLSTEEAAAYWNAIVEETGAGLIRIDISAQKFRRLCREGHLDSAGVEVMETTKGYLISRSDLIHAAYGQCDAMCGRLAEEQLKVWPGKKTRAES